MATDVGLSGWPWQACISYSKTASGREIGCLPKMLVWWWQSVGGCCCCDDREPGSCEKKKAAALAWCPCLQPHPSRKHASAGGRKRRSEWGWALSERPAAAADAEDDAAASPCCPHTACCFQRILFSLHLLLARIAHEHRDGWRSVRRERESGASLQTSGCTSWEEEGGRRRGGGGGGGGGSKQIRWDKVSYAMPSTGNQRKERVRVLNF